MCVLIGAFVFAVQTLVEAGDEVLLLEPFFDLYIGQIRLTGATPTYCPLEPDGNKGFKLDTHLLR
jgi:aspartate/methionine/tyrosine aminotransferase